MPFANERLEDHAQVRVDVGGAVLPAEASLPALDADGALLQVDVRVLQLQHLAPPQAGVDHHREDRHGAFTLVLRAPGVVPRRIEDTDELRAFERLRERGLEARRLRAAVRIAEAFDLLQVVKERSQRTPVRVRCDRGEPAFPVPRHPSIEKLDARAELHRSAAGIEEELPEARERDAVHLDARRAVIQHELRVVTKLRVLLDQLVEERPVVGGEEGRCDLLLKSLRSRFFRRGLRSLVAGLGHGSEEEGWDARATRSVLSSDPQRTERLEVR